MYACSCAKFGNPLNPPWLKYMCCIQEDETYKAKELHSLQSEVEWLREENSDLSQRMEEVLASNDALRRGSLLLQEKSEALLEELSIKEAEWSQREDRLKEEASYKELYT